MTTDLFFTLQLLDCFPDLRPTADVSHYLEKGSLPRHQLQHRFQIVDVGRVALRCQIMLWSRRKEVTSRRNQDR